MSKTEFHCVLCNILLEGIKFNLKNNNSKYSDTPLISIIENVVGKFLTLYFEICMQCYNLLNELDAIEMRQTEIRNQFKKYLEHHSQNISSSQEEPSQNTSSSIVKEINDIKPLSCSDIIETNVLLSETSDLKPSIKLDTNTTGAPLNISNVSKQNTPISNSETDKPISKKNGKKKEHVDLSKLYKCQCSKEFRTAGELKNHMNTHSNHRAFVCEICGQSYKHKAAFNIHMDMHNGINPFTCIYCNKSFTQKGALIRHVPIHTG